MFDNAADFFGTLWWSVICVVAGFCGTVYLWPQIKKWINR